MIERVLEKVNYTLLNAGAYPSHFSLSMHSLHIVKVNKWGCDCPPVHLLQLWWNLVHIRLM